MTGIDCCARGFFARTSAFFRRLPGDWLVTAARSSIFRLFYQMLLPYLSIYTLGLGATGSSLALVHALGLAAAALLAPWTGTLIDRIGPKKVYLAGIALLGLSWLAYGLARSWPMIIAAMTFYYIGYRTSGHCCSGICGTCLPKQDRATAMSCCETLAAGLLSMAGPMIGALLVSRAGGPSVKAIRPLFFIALAGTAASFALVYFKLSSSPRIAATRAAGKNFLKEIPEVFKHGKYLKSLVAISVIAQLPQSMILPFAQPFAKMRGASTWVLGAMVTSAALLPFLFGIIIGRLSDRVGRKKLIYAVSPLFWLSCVLLMLAKSDTAFIVSGVLQGAFSICGVIVGALQFEVVEPAYMGRWLGVLGFFQLLCQAVLVMFTGIIWDRIGPQYVFIIPLVLDIFVKTPLLFGIREQSLVKAA